MNEFFQSDVSWLGQSDKTKKAAQNNNALKIELAAPSWLVWGPLKDYTRPPRRYRRTDDGVLLPRKSENNIMLMNCINYTKIL